MNIEYKSHRAKDSEHDSLMSFLNEVFGFDVPNDGGFAAMLPGLYKEEYKPCQNNIVAYKNGKICAAVGIYYNSLYVSGKTLKVASLGNVAVAKDCRGEGYMKKTMQQSLEDMKQNKADISFLGGDRHRYMYFSYERGAIHYNFSLNETSLRHSTMDKKLKNFKIVEVRENSHKELDHIHSLYMGQAVHMKRSRTSLFDTLKAWNSHPYAAYENENFAGYFVLKNAHDQVLEFYPKNLDDTASLAACAIDLSKIHDGQKTATFIMSEHESEKMNLLLPLCETHHLSHGTQVTILNFERVIDAYLRLKSSYRPLLNGELVLHIHGENKEENLCISIKDNQVCVCPSTKTPHMELSHLEAVRLLCSIYSEHQNSLPPECSSWFPLPISLSHIDDV